MFFVSLLVFAFCRCFCGLSAIHYLLLNAILSPSCILLCSFFCVVSQCLNFMCQLSEHSVPSSLLTPFVTSLYFLFQYAQKLAQLVGQSICWPLSGRLAADCWLLCVTAIFIEAIMPVNRYLCVFMCVCAAITVTVFMIPVQTEGCSCVSLRLLFKC